MEGRRRRGRLRWEDSVNRDLMGLGERVENATERRRVVEMAVK